MDDRSRRQGGADPDDLAAQLDLAGAVGEAAAAGRAPSRRTRRGRSAATHRGTRERPRQRESLELVLHAASMVTCGRRDRRRSAGSHRRGRRRLRLLAMALPIEDYAVLGDTGTAALVGRDGSIDWLCLPRFDSQACFAALLGEPRHGRWLLGSGRPGRRRPPARTSSDTFVLETIHRTKDGAVKVTDLMPIGGRPRRPGPARRGARGHGPDAARVDRALQLRQGPAVGERAAGPERAAKSSRRSPGRTCSCCAATGCPKASDGVHEDDFDVHAGDTLTFSTTWFKSHRDDPADARRRRADRAHRSRSRRTGPTSARTTGPYREAVVRSLLVLRLLTHGEHRRHRRGRRPRRCPRTSAASATGTTASAGCATRR